MSAKATSVHAARALTNETTKDLDYWFPDLPACRHITENPTTTIDPSKVTCGLCKRLLAKVATSGKRKAIR